MTSPDPFPSAGGEPAPPDPRLRVWSRVQAVVFILFCLEMGVVLALFPWSSLWDRNYFFTLAPRWSEIFSSSYLRGAISGLGLVNVIIAVREAWRLRSS